MKDRIEKIAERKAIRMKKGGTYINLPAQWVKQYFKKDGYVPVFNLYTVENGLLLRLKKYQKK
jgi:hypothetical protein